MSSALFANFLTSDILEETKLKPWYETVRGYLVFTNVLVSIYMVYDVKSDSLLNCVSANASDVEFAASTTTYANSYCSAQLLNWHQRNLGLVCLFCSLLIYFSYSWWLLIPSVKKRFALIRECDDTLKELKLRPEDIKSIVLSVNKKEKPNAEYSEEEISELKAVIYRLWGDHSGTIYLFIIYGIRNFISLVILVSVFIMLMFLITSKIDNLVECELDILDGALAHCFMPAQDKFLPFVFAILVITSAVWIGTFALFCVFTRNACMISEKVRMAVSLRQGIMTRENHSPHERRNCDLYMRAYFSRNQRFRQYSDIFVQIFSNSATPLSRNTKAVIERWDIADRDQKTLMLPDPLNILKMPAEDQNHESTKHEFDSNARNTKLIAMHDDVRRGRRFNEFLSKHRQTYKIYGNIESYGTSMSDQCCQCKDLFAEEIELDSMGKSLMWHAFSNLNVAHRHRKTLAAHLVLSSVDKDGNSRPSSRVTESNRTLATSSLEYLEQEISDADLPVRTSRAHLNMVRKFVGTDRPKPSMSHRHNVSFSLEDVSEDESSEEANETMAFCGCCPDVPGQPLLSRW